ncbi:MoaD/ThiS family protein [Ectopseudomonas composti]|jgi:molybdopterin synthase sulfur carrier subunit|uniref:Molybdopterin synthase sulfur carrier subunit n=1 Tax=Ectopseudomonas composti TaxID=658457 RepID=A0A1I5J5H7_9GAMM|nr:MULTISPECIES: MoaD/ThiS family protein [Pseudomonas]EZH77205.1 molybdenum cofactor biosynthesis protein MoaD [Pseudomonas composti]MDN5516567.1 MoaD/ThiS family protein [Pseudomonas sp.]QNH05679.1 MoaD/ThiS family protein [Pseudomonas sp. B11D7D]SFO68088.1 molybdopterin synthase subunit MoaD [Pseudomonas composti]
MIRVQYFARYREALGRDDEQLSGDFATLDDLRLHLVARGDEWEVLGEQNLMCARNQELCSLDEPLAEGDEVAFFPTVTGG